MRNVHGYILFGLTAAVLAVYGALAWVLFVPTPQQAAEEVLLLPTRIIDVTSVAAQSGETAMLTDAPATSTQNAASPTPQPTLPPTTEPTLEPTSTETVSSLEPAQIELQPTDTAMARTATPAATDIPQRTEATINTRADGDVVALEVTIGCDPQELITTLENKIDVINLAPGCTYTYSAIDNSNTYGANALPLIDYPVVINGNGATIERDPGAPQFRLFFVNSGGDLTLNDLTLLNGNLPSNKNGGAINIRIGDVTLNNVDLFGHTAQHGGAIYVFDGGTLTAADSSISGNYAFNGGGAIYTTGLGSDVALTDSVLLNNQAVEGAAIYVGGAADLIATTTSFGAEGSPNQAGRRTSGPDVYYIGRGGAIYSTGSGTSVTLSQSIVEANIAYVGGGIYN
ncbi:MAG: hypothetical protein KC496_10505, partial [Anaerolineae bacterium]|nr:hypothetical protein [Anaerolineae bacterium]